MGDEKILVALDADHRTNPAVPEAVRFFLLEGLRVKNAAYGIYHPDYDAHVYRDVELHNVSAEPINGGHDEASLPYGNFTYDRLTLENCRLERDPLIQLTGIGFKPDLAGHFRGITLRNSQSGLTGIVDFGGGPRTKKIDNPISYYFHNTSGADTATRVASVKLPAVANDDAYQSMNGWTGPEARAVAASGILFPELLAPVDDLPPATLITGIQSVGARRLVRGVTHDNGEIRGVSVNGHSAKITSQHPGVADWNIMLDAPGDDRYLAQSTDDAGNTELMPHNLNLHATH